MAVTRKTNTMSKAKRENLIRGSMPDGYHQWAFRRLADKLFKGEHGPTLQWVMEKLVALESPPVLDRLGASFEAYEREQGNARVLPLSRRRVGVEGADEARGETDSGRPGRG